MEKNKPPKVEKYMDIDGNLIIEQWKLLDKSKRLIYDLEKCVGCSLCYTICPSNAIELGPIPEIAQKLIEETPAVLVDTEKCSFCFMCAKVCINSVYKVVDENEQEIDLHEYPSLKQMWLWDEESCKFDPDKEICLICKEIRDPKNVKQGKHFSKDLKKVVDRCPTKSMQFISPFKGKVIILKNRLHRCDPNGCKACVNICPTESFFIPQSAQEIEKFGKIACNEETCMYCGACENACPEKLIIVKRDSVDLEIPPESKNKPWIKRWLKQFQRLLMPKEEIEKIKEEESNFKLPSLEEEIIDYDENLLISPTIEFDPNELKKELEQNKKILEIITDDFNKAFFRYFIRRKKIDKLKNFIKKSLKNHSAN
ncbi:MAG: 4Fe-4S dicluster domain-containing protein [Promethearchaeota archaeon]